MSPSFRYLAVLWAGSVLLLLGGCASQNAYHDRPGTPGNCAEARRALASCQAAYWQEFPDFDLAFAEYTERGNAFDDRRIADVVHRIDRRSRAQGVVVVVFVHGWHHNAAPADGNLTAFRDALQHMGRSGPLNGRRLIGLYVGWRGVSLDLPGLRYLTFWDRKAVAEAVGGGAVTRLLMDLQQIDRQRPGNVLAVVGHSFGGAIVINALNEVLTAQIVARGANGHTGEGAEAACSARAPARQPDAVPLAADAIIVLNPAIEANRALPLVETALQYRYPPGQVPLFISISTDADWATHFAFPAGQAADLLATWHQADLHRACYRDRVTGTPLTLREQHLDATTVGNFAPFLTHRVRVHDGTPVPRIERLPCAETPDECRPRGWTSLAGHPMLGPLPPHYPLYFIKTDRSLMAGHNDIFNPRLRAFLLVLIDDAIRRTARLAMRPAAVVPPGVIVIPAGAPAGRGEPVAEGAAPGAVPPAPAGAAAGAPGEAGETAPAGASGGSGARLEDFSPPPGPALLDDERTLNERFCLYFLKGQQ